jgi:MFS family permease
MTAVAPQVISLTKLDGPHCRYAVGPLIGGYIGELIGDHAPAYLSVLLFAGLIPVTLYFLPETSPMAAGHRHKEKGPVKAMTSFQGEMGDPTEGRDTQGDSTETGNPRRRVLSLLALIVLPEFAVIAVSRQHHVLSPWLGLAVFVVSISASNGS